MEKHANESIQEKEKIVPGSSKGSNRTHSNRDALGSMDVLKYLVWDVSGPACGMGTGRRSHCNDRLCAWAYCQIPGEAGHVFSQDNKKERL